MKRNVFGMGSPPFLPAFSPLALFGTFDWYEPNLWHARAVHNDVFTPHGSRDQLGKASLGLGDVHMNGHGLKIGWSTMLVKLAAKSCSLLPLDGAGRFACIIVDDAVDALHLVDDARRGV
jgi:hypothetical protein